MTFVEKNYWLSMILITPFHKMESQLRTTETYLMFSEESKTLLENQLDFK
jgi:hypothetical protein